MTVTGIQETEAELLEPRSLRAPGQHCETLSQKKEGIMSYILNKIAVRFKCVDYVFAITVITINQM